MDGMTSPAPELSVVILCYGAEDAAEEFVGRMEGILQRARISDYQLVLVGNYVQDSCDRTPEVVRRLAESNPRIEYVAEPKRGWMGWDMRSGLRRARGNLIAVIDGDGQMPVSDLPAVYEKIRRDDLDLVKTFRTTRGDGPLRKLISYVYNSVFHALFPGLTARDINSKPKILTRASYEKLRLTSDDWFIDAEIMIQARRLGFRIGEVPTTFHGLTGRRSFIGVGAVLEFVKNLVVFRLRELRESNKN